MSGVERCTELVGYSAISNMANVTTVTPADLHDEPPVVYPSYGHRVAYATVIAVISLLGVLGNSLVIVSVVAYRKLRTKTNAFVVSLSGADLFNCLNLPWMSLAVLSVDGWPLPDWVCSIASASLLVSIGSSVYSLAGIALCRCALITMSPSEYAQCLTTRRLGLLMAVVWSIPLVVSLTPLTFAPDFLGFNEQYCMCIWNTSHWFSMAYNVILSACLFPLPLSVIVVSYTRIWRHVRRHARRMARVSAQSISGAVDGAAARKAGVNRRQMAVTVNMLVVLCVFLICVMPYSVLLVLPGGEIVVPAFGVILLSNSCINPLIYATRHPDFKLAFAKILRCKCLDPKSGRSREPRSERSRDRVLQTTQT